MSIDVRLRDVSGKFVFAKVPVKATTHDLYWIVKRNYIVDPDSNIRMVLNGKDIMANTPEPLDKDNLFYVLRGELKKIIPEGPAEIVAPSLEDLFDEQARLETMLQDMRKNYGTAARAKRKECEDTCAAKEAEALALETAAIDRLTKMVDDYALRLDAAVGAS
jgi:hypothetical protein